ncbi:methyltransferase domain-containing protein [Mycolicibacterium alvei]|uniref:Methyltransferase type 11 domain-containing protein n=1 Tax=Mycolicibacterium alvei TaxID=67081 RepID=A0A6N4UQ87_9MYCO|nr:methyltransferase domain-containing protein [Mycolicibacterium alvei]BBX25681.1 hypothetical protein MALV_08060 [Mycolicibacterium alvei]
MRHGPANRPYGQAGGCPGRGPVIGDARVAATRAPNRLVCAAGRRLPLPYGVADVAITIATLEFTDTPMVLAKLDRITRPGGRIIALALNSGSLSGLLDQPTRRAPFSTADYLTRDELRRLSSRHGRVRVSGRLFTAAPWLGAIQVLVVERPM